MSVQIKDSQESADTKGWLCKHPLHSNHSDQTCRIHVGMYACTVLESTLNQRESHQLTIVWRCRLHWRSDPERLSIVGLHSRLWRWLWNCTCKTRGNADRMKSSGISHTAARAPIFPKHRSCLVRKSTEFPSPQLKRISVEEVQTSWNESFRDSEGGEKHTTCTMWSSGALVSRRVALQDARKPPASGHEGGTVIADRILITNSWTPRTTFILGIHEPWSQHKLGLWIKRGNKLANGTDYPQRQTNFFFSDVRRPVDKWELQKVEGK